MIFGKAPSLRFVAYDSLQQRLSVGLTKMIFKELVVEVGFCNCDTPSSVLNAFSQDIIFLTESLSVLEYEVGYFV